MINKYCNDNEENFFRVNSFLNHFHINFIVLPSINWSDIEVPIPTNLFERFTQQSIHTPIQLFGIDQTLWSQCRTFALHRAKQGFVDPISILYTSFKHYYPFNVTLNIFTRWLLLDPDNQTEFSLNSLRYPIFETTTELVKYCQINQPIHFVDSTTNIDQIWFLLPISFLISSNTSILTPDHIVLDNNTTRLSVNYKKNSYQRLHCLVAITPSGKYSNQLLISKPGRYIKIDFPSNQFTRIVESSGDILYEHLQQWLEDFLAGSYSNKNRYNSHQSFIIESFFFLSPILVLFSSIHV